MDAADVRKVMLEEPPATHLGADDPKVVAARQALTDGCEGNWIAFNRAHDVSLPGSAGKAVAFLMYPQGEVGGARLNCLSTPGSSDIASRRAKFPPEEATPWTLPPFA